MPKNKALPGSEPLSIEQAWRDGDELKLIDAVVKKYARVLDMTDSGRDIKPLVTGMFDAIDRLRAVKAHLDVQGSETPLAQILREAEEALEHA